MGDSYNKNIDFWCLGIFLYELLSGTTPFIDNKKLIIKKNIVENKP